MNEKKFFLLITLRSSRRNLSITLPDLRSRFNSLPAFEIHEPDDNLLGWRKKIFGNDAIKLKKGKLSLKISRGKVIVVE